MKIDNVKMDNVKMDSVLAELEELEPVSIDRLVELGAEKGSLSDLMVKYHDEPTIYDRLSEVIEEYGQNVKDLHVSLTIFDGEKEVKTVMI